MMGAQMAEAKETTVKSQVLELASDMDDMEDQEVLERLNEIYEYWFLPWGAES